MKLWKRTAALLLCLGVSFSAVACDDENNSISSENTPPASSEQTDSSSSEVEEVLKNQELADVLAVAKSAKINFELAYDVLGYRLGGTSDPDTGEVTYNSVWENKEKGTLSGDVLLAATDKGVDAKITFTLPKTEEIINGYVGGDYEICIIDGFIYLLEPKAIAYKTLTNESLYAYIDNLITMIGVSAEDVEALLGQVFSELEGLGVTSEEINGVIAGLLSDAKIEPSFGNILMVTLDVAPYVNDVIEYAKTLTGETTLGEVLNEALAYGVAEEETAITYNDILDAVITMSDSTVQEAYDYVDDLVKDATSYSLRMCWLLLIENEDVRSALIEAGFTEEKLDELADINFEDAIEPYAEYTLEEMLTKFIDENLYLIEDWLNPDDGNEDWESTGRPALETIDVSVYAEEARTFLATKTIEDLGLTQVLKGIQSMNVTELCVKAGVGYDQNLNAEKVVVAFIQNMYGTDTVVVNGEPQTVDLKSNYVLTITASDFSSETLEIVLQADKNVVYECASCGESSAIDASVQIREDICLCDNCYETYEEVE